MIPPFRLDPRTVLLTATTLLLAVAVASPLDARPSAATGPAASTSPSPAVTANPAPSAPSAASTGPNPAAAPDARGASPGTGPARWSPPEVAPAAAGWRSPVGAPVIVLRDFTPPDTPYGPGHRGVDLLVPTGAAVRAAGDGLVTYAGPVAGRGVVVVSHGSVRTTYEPVTATVTVGQRVGTGNMIGLVEAGHDGCPEGCLHWGLLRGDVYLDPLALLRPARPRLLPLATWAGG